MSYVQPLSIGATPSVQFSTMSEKLFLELFYHTFKNLGKNMPPQRPVTDLCIKKPEVYIKLIYHFKISYKNKIKKMKTNNYEMYN